MPIPKTLSAPKRTRPEKWIRTAGTLVPALILLTLSMAACDLYSQDEFEPDYVIESYLVAGRPLPQLRLSQTTPIDEKYEFTQAAVNNAVVEVRLLTPSGGIEERFAYNQQSAGVYIPAESHAVLPERSYRLHVQIPETGTEVTAVTRVPGRFEGTGEVDRIAYQDPAQIVINTTRSAYPGRQSYFIFNVNVVNPSPENLTPFYNDLVDDQDEDITDYFKNSSGIINEDNYDRNTDGTLTLRVPWLAVAFYGENDIVANAIDDNMYDFLRSQEVQGGGSTLPPGEFQNVIYHVEGGIGIFGSLASDTVRVFIERNEGLNE